MSNNIRLDVVQKEIVNSSARNIIVAAGAGSGKTRVLTERVKKLLKDGINPESMVVITFTNLAAEELQERLQNVSGSDKCFIGTIHSLANKLLSNTDYDFEIFSEYHQDMYMKFLIDKFAKYCTYKDYEKLVKMFKSVRLGVIEYYDMVRNFEKHTLDELYILLGNNQQHNTLSYDNYPYDVMELCKINHVITFDELIIKCTEYFHEQDTNIEYLFVDEFQDVGNLEFDFLMDLNASNNFFIGDDYQSIYGFKGGDVDIFLSLLKDPNWQPYYMTNNYRNAAEILDFANRVIANANNIIPKTTHCISKEPGSLSIKQKSEIDKFLTYKLSNEKDYKHWFILVRTNKDLNYLATLLESCKIPVVTFKQADINKKEMDSALQQNVVKLLTIHTSKGLEEDNVLLYGNFPIKPSETTKSEEIKVFYVGITRARKNLIIFKGR